MKPKKRTRKPKKISPVSREITLWEATAACKIAAGRGLEPAEILISIAHCIADSGTRCRHRDVCRLLVLAAAVKMAEIIRQAGHEEIIKEEKND